MGSTPQCARLSLTLFRVMFLCLAPLSSGLRENRRTRSSLGPRELSHLPGSSPVSLSQYCSSYPVHQVNSYSYLKTHFGEGKWYLSPQKDGQAVWSQEACCLCQVCQGQTAGCRDRTRVLWFGVNFMHHQRKDASRKNPLSDWLGLL